MESSAKHFFHMGKKTTGGSGAAVSILNRLVSEVNRGESRIAMRKAATTSQARGESAVRFQPIGSNASFAFLCGTHCNQGFSLSKTNDKLIRTVG